jgi:ribonuclease H2 subunit A
MLRHPPINLNKQAEDATIALIHEVIDSGVHLSEVKPSFSPRSLPLCLQPFLIQVYVDALGNTKTYEQHLASLFPGIAFTVTAKADSKFKIVGAASVAAKVTRDAWVTGWVFEEHENQRSSPAYTWPEECGSGYPSGMFLCYLCTPLSRSICCPLYNFPFIQR